MKISIKLLTLIILPMIIFSCSEYSGGWLSEDDIKAGVYRHYEVSPNATPEDASYIHNIDFMELVKEVDSKGREEQHYWYCMTMTIRYYTYLPEDLGKKVLVEKTLDKLGVITAWKRKGEIKASHDLRDTANHKYRKICE